MLRAANLRRGPQDEATADIEVHLYGARTGQGETFRALGDFVLNRIVTGFAIETERDHRPENE